MIYLFFAVMFGILFFFFKHIEKKDDYIFVALALALVFIQSSVWFNADIYDKIGYIETKNCSNTYFNVSETAYFLNTSSCATTYSINYNNTDGYYDVDRYFEFKAFDSNIIDLSGIMLFGILILGVCYTAYKGLKIENFIR